MLCTRTFTLGTVTFRDTGWIIMNTLAVLKHRFRTALGQLVEDSEVDSLAAMLTQSQDARFGDYQANCAMPLGKKLGKAPRDIASQLVAELDIGDVCGSVDVAGPGFVNLKLSESWLASELETIRRDDRLGVSAAVVPRTFVVDFSSPNVAKPMHVGHIRSTVIGDALCRILRFLGHNVTSDNHLGDWGTQFGMIIYGYRHFVDLEAYEANPVSELGRVYREVRALMDYHDGVASLPCQRETLAQLESKLLLAEEQAPTGDAKKDKKARKQLSKLREDVQRQRSAVQALESKLAVTDGDPVAKARADKHATVSQSVLEETAKLHAGEAENRELWESFLPKCRDEIDRIYKRLDVTFDREHGESFYHDKLPEVVDRFKELELAEESEGAVCVFLDGFDAPMIIQKKDGAFLYATTDLATIAYRMDEWNPDAILYVVDFRQGEHFGKLFAAARAWGYQDVELSHISFGTVLGEDGKPLKTRSGVLISLDSLLDEAVDRARKVVSENDDNKKGGPELSSEQRDEIANVVGHAAIKYADLSQNRTSDYVFSYDKMVAMQGNTATYLQYSYARIQNIFAKGNVDIEQLRNGNASFILNSDHERNLAIQLLRFHETLEEVIEDYRPNVLANYLYQLAKRISEFYSACPVLKAEEEKLRESRLLLCDLVAPNDEARPCRCLASELSTKCSLSRDENGLMPKTDSVELDRVLHGDCEHILANLPSEFVNSIVTSPPYFQQRHYSVDDEVGQESTPEEYTHRMVAIFRQARRVSQGRGHSVVSGLVTNTETVSNLVCPGASLSRCRMTVGFCEATLSGTSPTQCPLP